MSKKISPELQLAIDGYRGQVKKIKEGIATAHYKGFVSRKDVAPLTSHELATRALQNSGAEKKAYNLFTKGSKKKRARALYLLNGGK